MSIQEISSNFKRFLQEDDTQVAFVLILVGMTSFMLGRASVQSYTIESREGIIQAAAIDVSDLEAVPGTKANEEITPLTSTSEGMYVASKTGSKYHLPWCSGAQRIKEENKVWFASKEEAEKSGYTPAANCKGI